jgi:hypothetical protein
VRRKTVGLGTSLSIRRSANSPNACGRAAAGYGESVSAWERVVRSVLLGFNLLLFAALPVFLFDQRLGVFLMLAALIGFFLTHLIVGIVGYRQTMRRPWPKVPPVDDEDDEW